MAPVFIVLLAHGGLAQRWWALAVFAVASLTDRFDGQLARSRGQVTVFGTLADPIADKALTLGAFITLAALGEIPWWMAIVIAVRELGVTLMRAVLARRSVIAASTGGKIKTTLQMLAIILFLVPWSSFMVDTIPTAVAWAALWGAVAVTLLTGVDYAVRGWRLWHAGPPAQPDAPGPDGPEPPAAPGQ